MESSSWSPKLKDTLVALKRPTKYASHSDRYLRVLRYMSTAPQMLQEIGEANGVSSLTSVARTTTSLVEALKTVQLDKVDSDGVMISMAECIYGVICSIIAVCHESADEGISRRTGRGISQFIVTLKTAVSYIHIQEGVKTVVVGKSSRLLRRLSTGSQSHPLHDECVKCLQKSMEIFQVQSKDGFVSDNLDLMHAETTQLHQDLMETLKSRYLKRNGSSLWSLSDTLRIFKRHEESLNEIVYALCKELEFDAARIAILGSRGVGKTSLALAALHHSDVVNRYGARRYFIDCSAVQSADHLIERVAKFFGFKRIVTPIQAIKIFFIKLEERALLVLDDFPIFEEGSRSEMLLALFNDMKHVDVLVTTIGSARPSGLQWTRSVRPHRQLEVLDDDQPFIDDEDTRYSDDVVQDTDDSKTVSFGAASMPTSPSSPPTSSPGLTLTETNNSLTGFPAFPSPVSSFSPFICSVSQIKKYYPGLSSWINPLSKPWKSRFLMLSCPARQSDSRLHPVAYLHVFKSSNPIELELERLEVDGKSFVTPGHERGSGIQRYVLRVGGLGMYIENKNKLDFEVNGVTTWCFQVQDDEDARKWMTAIDAAVRPPSRPQSYQAIQSSAPEKSQFQQIQELSVKASPSHRAEVSEIISDESIAELSHDWAYLSFESNLDTTPSPISRDSHDLDPIFIVYEKLSDIFRDRVQYKRILGYRDNRAQLLLDFLQSLLDHPKLKGKLRTDLMRALVRLSKQSALYPTCFALKNVQMYGEDPLNGGHFGDIWKGRYQTQNVCLKVVKVYQKSDIKKLLAAFSVEALLWAQLSHANLLPFYGVYHLEDKYNKICLVSPWMVNGNIHEFLQQNLAVNRFLLVSDVIEGIIYLHDNHMIHGDLKGANILVAPSGRACLADFGLSAVAESDALRWTSLTSTAPRGGTVRWQAPELISSSDESEISRSPASDIYAFACVCYEIFTGQCPFFDIVMDVTVMLKVVKGERPPRPPPTHLAWVEWGLSDVIWELIGHCWKQDPADRPMAIEVRKLIQPSLAGILDKRPNGDWNNLSTSRFRGTVHDYPTIKELEALLN